MTNYGLGGLCEPHLDPHGIFELKDGFYGKERPELYDLGDVLGTFMAWLNNVQEGGGTAFIGSNFSISAEKGSAAFWYDLKSDGFRDSLTKHGGCPVFVGSKWILNKWLYWYDNFKKFPCKIDRRRAFDLPSENHYYT